MSERNKRVAVITAANRGVGLWIVKKLAEKFDGIIYVTTKDPDKGDSLLKELKEIESVRYLNLDTEMEESIARLAEHIKQTHGHIDILVNNTEIHPVSGIVFFYRDFLIISALINSII